MDGSRFDAWTRRRFGWTLGGGVASLLSLSALETATAKKKRKKKRGCAFWFLSGGPDVNARIRVDDDLTITLNGDVVFADDDEGSTTLCPLFFEARPGDRLRIVAVDTDTDCYELSPLYLHCFPGGTARKLSDGVPEVCENPAPAGEFFDETFTI